MASLVLLGAAALWLGTAEPLPARSAISYFLLTLALRHEFLFASFSRNGFAWQLKARLGPERAFFLHESLTALIVFAQRTSFLAMLAATAHASSGPFGMALVALGALLVALGVAVNIWAAKTIGLDTVQYRDLFMGPPHMSIELRGPYALWPNPMYGVGQLAVYGAALMVLSPVGVLAAALHQVALLLFNDVIEQPLLRRANSSLMEAQLRYALSRTGFDPRSELGERRRSQPPARIRRDSH